MNTAKKPLPGRIIGIDYGLSRLGLSVSDEQHIIATPLTTFIAEKRCEATVIKLIAELNRHSELHRYIIQEIVVGLPLLMNGKKGFFADEVLHFMELLRNHIDVPIISWDERLSSVQADRSLRESNMTRKKRSKSVDSVAAIIILQNYLDSKKERIKAEG